MSVAEVESGFRTIGQDASRRAVLRAAAAGRLQRTLLVHGPAGAGKGAFVDDLLALLFCAAPDAERGPCNACRGCRDARARTHPDLVIGSPEAWREARSSGESIVAAARRWLLDGAGAPVAGPRRVVLVEGADRANEQTQNALLKALEEPSARHMFVLVADEPSRVLPTIRSRSQSLRVGPVPSNELVPWLMDRRGLPVEQAEALARIGGGLVGRAMGLADNPPLVEWRRRTQGELLDLLGRGPADRFGSMREMLDIAARHATPEVEASAEDGQPVSGAAQRAAATLIVDAWLDLARDLMLAAVGREKLAPASQLLDELHAVAARLPMASLTAFIGVLEEAREGLRQNAAPRLALEAAVLRWPALPAPPRA